MFHFLKAGGNIGKDHLRYLQEYFDEKGIENQIHQGVLYGDEIEEGDCYLTCSVDAFEANEIEMERVFEVQLAHNLTGIKGTPFNQSSADLNLFGGRQVAKYQNLDLSDPRFVIGGYAKWDFIYPERFRVEERRKELVEKRGLNPSIPWVCFYPTGPNKMVRGGLTRVFSVLLEVEEKLGPMEFLVCNHGQNKKKLGTKETLKKLRGLLGDEDGVFDSSKVEGSGESRVHLVDGALALPYITACHLFITDVASTLITALSMEKPVVLIPLEVKEQQAADKTGMQKAAFLEDIEDLKSFLSDYETSRPLRELFERCVEFDDDKNRERLTDLICKRYEEWKKNRGSK